MEQTRSVVAFAALALLAGCASQVIEPSSAGYAKPTVKALESVSVELSPKAKELLADNVKFDPEVLSKTLDRTLKERNLVASDGDFRLKVVVSDVRVRGTFNAVMWGFMAGDDHLIGDSLLLRKDQQEPVYVFTVKTSYALGGLAGGQDSLRMDWLYQEFSNKVANQLVALRDKKP